jgi:carboxypeptidase PM20D1
MLYGVVTAFVILTLIIIVRSLLFKNDTHISPIKKTKIQIDVNQSAQILSEGIQIKTVSRAEANETDLQVFADYHKKLQIFFPLVHQHMQVEKVNTYSLLYQWKGKNQEEKPILITAHMDVVPIEEGTEDNWTYPPFSGAIEEGYIWGRGSLDTKITMLSALNAAELLLENDFVPDKDIYFAFAHDEEIRGTKGANAIAEIFKKRGLEFDFLMDEGGTVVENAIKGIKKPIAFIGIAEKGFANVKIRVRDSGGHASMPPRNTALGQVAKVITNLEKNQSKANLSEPVKDFLVTIGPEMKGMNKIILANLWLFKSLFIQIFAKTKSRNALLRTTTASTMASGSQVANVLPETASAIFNFIISPGETVDDLITHIKKVNKNIKMEIEVLIGENPSIISSTHSRGFELIKGITHLLYEEALISPYIVLAATDARKYEGVCQNIYRFAPYRIDNADLSRIHGTNEKISLENVKQCVEFYVTLFENI